MLLVLQVHQLKLMSILKLLLGLGRVLVHTVEIRLEVPLRVLTVLLGGVALLLQEFELTLPKGLVTVVSIVQVLVLAVELR